MATDEEVEGSGPWKHYKAGHSVTMHGGLLEVECSCGEIWLINEDGHIVENPEDAKVVVPVEEKE